MDNVKAITKRIRDAREFCEYSTEEMAKKLGLAEAEYIEYENGENDLPISLLYNIATALELDPSILLFGKNSSNAVAAVVYNGNGANIERYPGYSFVSLASEFINRNMEPMIVTIKQGTTPEPVQHGGHEFNYVLKGTLRVIIENKEFYLRAGDSIYFDASAPHAQLAMDKTAKFLCIIQK